MKNAEARLLARPGVAKGGRGRRTRGGGDGAAVHGAQTGTVTSSGGGTPMARPGHPADAGIGSLPPLRVQRLLQQCGRCRSRLRECAESLRRTRGQLRKGAAQMAAQRRQFFGVLETMPAMICVLAPDHRVCFANRAFRRMFGLAQGRRCDECCWRQGKPCASCETFVALRTGRPRRWQFHSPDGDAMLEAHAIPFTEADGSPRVLEVCFDITHARLAEMALKEREERLRLFIEHAPTSIAMFDREMRYVAASRRWRADYRLGSDIIGRPHYTLVPDTSRRWKGLHRRCLAGEVLHSDGERCQRADGAVQWVRWDLVPWRMPGGGIGGILVATEEITERKRLEQLTERTLDAMTRLQGLAALSVPEGGVARVLAEILDAAIAIAGADMGDIQLLDPATGDLRILAARSLSRRWLGFWNRVATGHGTSGTALERRERVVVEDVEKSPIFRRRDAMAVLREAGVRALQSTPLITRAGKPVGIFSTHYRTPRRPDETALQLLDLLARQAADLIEGMQTATALRESEARLRALVLASSDVVYRMNADWSERLALLGRNRVADSPEPTRAWLQKYVPSGAQAPMMEAIREAIRNKSSFELEHRVLHVDGSQGWMLTRAVPVLDDTGRIAEWFGMGCDVTARKDADLARSRLAAIVDSSTDAISAVDLDGIITAWAPGAERLYGYTIEEAVGRPISLIVPPDRRWEIPMFIERSRRGERTIGFETVRVCKDGQQVPVAITISPVRDAAGRIVGLSGISRDIRERKRLENELLEAGEREQRRLGHDLHDGLGQELNGLSYLARLLERELRNDLPARATEAGRLAKGLGRALQLARDLAHGLQPVSPVPEGLETTLREFARATRELFRVDCRFVCRRPVLVHQHGAATHLFRIAQEAVNNAIKHGHSSRIRILLTVTRRGLVLGIRDNGDGIRRRRPSANGMGLHIMQYRADAIRGSLVIRRRTGGGTEVVCTVADRSLLREEGEAP